MHRRFLLTQINNKAQRKEGLPERKESGSAAIQSGDASPHSKVSRRPRGTIENFLQPVSQVDR